MSITWQNLRSWEGSQQLAFEEICCQLAAAEPPTASAKFTRKGTPDAGVECFWRLANGDEHAWQAKFFSGTPDKGQWKNLDESVRTALDKHPKLRRYVICLPSDRPDPRLRTSQGDMQSWFMDKWHERVSIWEGWAQAKGRIVTFEYWGTHELFQRLSQEKHQGRMLFWFDQELFSDDWFWRKWRVARADAGERYTPELNVQLPVARLFDGLGRNLAFQLRFRKLHASVELKLTATKPRLGDARAQPAYKQLHSSVFRLLSLLADAPEDSTADIPLAAVQELVKSAQEQVYAYLAVLGEIRQSHLQSQKAGEVASDPTNREHTAVHELDGAIYALNNWVNSQQVKLANTSTLLLTGGPGIGKTHLFCDIAYLRLSQRQPTLLLLGQHFIAGNPWSQLLQQLGLTCSYEALLGALNAAAQARGAKAILLIDALNESQSRKIWKDHLAGMITAIREYPWLSIGLSVRSSYKDTVIPEHLLESSQLPQLTHQGFAQHEYQAAKTFFAAYEILRPNFPLLAPEFQNPLFLKLFCRGLKNRGLTRVPTGFQGISTVFSFLIDSVNEKLAGEEMLDYPVHRRLIQQALIAVAQNLAEQQRQWLPEAEAERLLLSLHTPPRQGYRNSLLHHLIAEGLLAKDRFYDSNMSTYVEGIRFTYERLADHYIVHYLLNTHLDASNPAASFAVGTPLGRLLLPELDFEFQGYIEALSVQLPEKLGLELAELAPYAADYDAVRAGFIQSIIWRVPTAFSPATKKYINAHIIPWPRSTASFLNALLTVAVNVDHPYNADFLHAHLLPFPMAERDAWWTIFLHEQYGQHQGVDQLVEWAWSAESKEHIADPPLLLASTALAWFLTSSNRFLRDRATKGLVALLTPRLDVLHQLLTRFQGVNDLYVLERLYAVAYGCVMRNHDATGVAAVAQSVYNWVFAEGQPIPHLLLRNYARGVLETAYMLKILPTDIEAASFRPPYQSGWPAIFPSKEDISQYDNHEPPTTSNRAQMAIYWSVMGGDFGRYVMESSWGRERWLSRLRSAPATLQERTDQFIGSLTRHQKKVLSEIAVFHKHFKQHQLKQDGWDQTPVPDEVWAALLQELEARLFKRLSEAKKSEYKELVAAGWASSSPTSDKDDFFPLSLAKQWVVQQVFELGWNQEYFGDFDQMVPSRGRSAQKSERIGKKYQWLAWLEFLARVTDNLRLNINRRYPKEPAVYSGPWQYNLRDIDPSCLLPPVTEPIDDQPSPSSSPWWHHSTYDAWDAGADNGNWLRTATDLPSVESLLLVDSPDNGQQWLCMGGEYVWQEPTPPEQDKHEITRREIWYRYQAFIIRQEDSESVFKWASRQDFMGRWMPEPQTMLETFLREYHWAPAYYDELEESPYQEWHLLTSPSRQRIPGPVLIPSIEYRAESAGFDCSVGEGYILQLPSRWLADTMQLKPLIQEGHYANAEGKLVAFDPSAEMPGPSTLLLNASLFQQFLTTQGYDLLWIVLGEKQVLPGADWEQRSGRLNITGAFRLRASSIEGNLSSSFQK